jgi:IclR family acetate operon transcriptional repressor
MLAALPESELDAFFAQATLSAYTPFSIIDEKTLRAELAEIRATGIGRTREEYTPGICGLGIVATIGGDPIGAFAVAIPLPRFSAELEARVIAPLRQVAQLLAAAEAPTA